MGRSPAEEAILTITPPPFSPITWATDRERKKAPLTLTSIILSQADSSTWIIGPKTGLVAALFTRISIVP